MNDWRRSDETGLSRRKKLMEMRARLILIVDEGGREGRGSSGGSNSDSGSGGVSGLVVVEFLIVELVVAANKSNE